MAYKELTSSWEVIERGGGSSAVRQFAEAPAGTSGEIVDIPAYDDPHPEDSLLRVSERSKKKLGGMPNLHLWTVTYTQVGSGKTDGEPPLKSLPISGTVGVEIRSVDGVSEGSVYKWKTTQAKITQQIPRPIINIPFKVSKRLMDVPITWLPGYVGKINSGDMNVRGASIKAGTCLFEGADFSEYRNEDNQVRFKVDLNFTIQLVPIALGVYGGWLYLLDPENPDGYFQEVEPPLFESADLQHLINLPEFV